MSRSTVIAATVGAGLGLGVGGYHAFRRRSSERYTSRPAALPAIAVGRDQVVFSYGSSF